MQAGVDTLADTVKTTLSPKGRNVSLRGAPLVTNDAASVATTLLTTMASVAEGNAAAPQ